MVVACIPCLILCTLQKIISQLKCTMDKHSKYVSHICIHNIIGYHGKKG
jgi:hypothetical protein